MSVNCDKVIDYALSQVGYLEKKTNKYLDDFTANAGYNNYTKYGRDYDKYMETRLNGNSWCGMAVSCWMVSAYGLQKAKKLLGGNLFSYTPAGAKMLKAKHRKPKKGDVVFFYHATMRRIAHTGLVYKVDDKYFYTVEGNTSSAVGVVRNGGCVAKKKYPINYATAYFGTPCYDKVGTGEIKTNKIATAIKTVGKNVNAKNPYKKPTTTITSKSKKNDVKWLQWELNQWKSSLVVDGIFGANTTAQVKAFQKAKRLVADGIAGSKTISALVKDR